MPNQYRKRSKTSPKPIKPSSKYSNLEEIAEVFAAMPRVRIGPNYSRADRANDFLSTFADEKGRRVLAQISDYCNPGPTEQQQLGALAFNEGRRSVFGWINVCMTKLSEPVVLREEEKK